MSLFYMTNKNCKQPIENTDLQLRFPQNFAFVLTYIALFCFLSVLTNSSWNEQWVFLIQNISQLKKKKKNLTSANDFSLDSNVLQKKRHDKKIFVSSYDLVHCKLVSKKYNID